MDVAEVMHYKPDICLGSKTQPVCDDYTSGTDNGVVDKEGPEETIPPPQTDLPPVGQGPAHGTGSPGEASVEEPPVSADDSYEVTWTVDIAIAVPRGEEEVKRDRRGKRAEAMLEVPRPQSYYHLEYNLLPEHREPVKVDLATFGPVVRIYKDNESKTLRPWCDGDQMWVSWSQSFRVSVTKKLLEELLSHRIHFRIWEGKDKVSSKARNDRPKAFKLPLALSEDGANVCGGIRNMVSWLRELTERDNSNISKKKRNTTTEIQRLSNEKTQEDGSGVKPQEQSKDTTTLSNQNDKNLAASHNGLQKAKTAVELENIKKNGIASVECSPLRLLAGATSLAECFSIVCPPGVCEALCNISLDRVLMSEQLKAELNPLVITILSANSMPSTPIPFHVLQEKCLPVYCQYQFHKLKMHKTKPQRHGRHVYFNDVLVVLAGSMGIGELREYLTGPPLEIQVHDRDRKPEKPPDTPGLFGTRPHDDKLSSVAFVGRKRTAHDPVAAETAQVYESHAVAHLDLSEMMLGRRSLKVNLPIRSCPPPQLLGRERPMWERKMMDLPGVAGGHREKPLEQGHYFDSNAHLKVKVEIAHPLLGGADSAVESDNCPLFGRIVFIFRSNNVSMLTKLRSEILKINTAAFNIGSCPPEILDRILSDYLVSPEESESKDLDFVTGFHVQDEKVHLVVAEGLRHKAVKCLWEMAPQKLGGSSEEQVRVLYSSGLGFSKRIYSSLDVNLSPVHLHRPLEDIMRNPLVYVRDMLPHSCFQALSRLSQLCQASKLLEAVRCDLFPTEDMIRSVSRELGTVPGKTEQKRQVEEEKEEVREEPDVVSSLTIWERRREPLDMHNAEYIKWKRLAAKQQLSENAKDYVQNNIREVQHTSMLVQKPKPAVLGPEPAVVGAAHNYSIQTFNSHRRGLELLRKEMAKVPDRRFTYSQQYQSATVEPGHSPRTPRAGTPFDCYTPREHPPRPDQSRVEELKKPWRENILHANTLRPPLTRDRWPWGRRLLDFQLYTTPPPLFGPPPPPPLVSIHLAGEQLVAAGGQRGGWPSKARSGGRSSPPDDRSRLQDFKCYQGAGSGKFREILKDEPRKYSLRKPGLALKPLPALAVLSWGEAEARDAENKALGPGPFAEKNFSAVNNAIPRSHSQYKKYRFTRYCVPHPFLHKRRSAPLTESERACLAVRGPDAKTPTPPCRRSTTVARPFRNLVEVRTHGAVTLYAQ